MPYHTGVIQALRHHKILTAIASLLILLVLIILYVAYGYNPGQASPSQSAYFSHSANQYINTDNFRIHYLVQGTGSPIILLPGSGEWVYEYRNLIPLLAEYHTVYALDLPGQGFTTANTKHPRYDLTTNSKALTSFMNQLHINKVTMLGHSFGGGNAIYFAEQNPGRIDKLILLDSTGVTDGNGLIWKLARLPVLGEVFSKFITKDIVKQTLESSLYHQNLITDDMVNETYVPNTFTQNRRAFYEQERQIDWAQTRDNLNKITAPTLLIWGKYDKLVNASDADYMHQHIAGSQLHFVDNAGHSSQEDNPAQIYGLINSFEK